MKQVLLITLSEGLRAGLQEALGPDIEVWSSWMDDDDDARSVVKSVGRSSPDVVVLGVDVELVRALEIAAAFSVDRPEIDVFITADATPRLWQHALRAGVRDILKPNEPFDDMRATIAHAIGVTDRRRANLIARDDPASDHKVIVVLSPKGGAGKTTIACNLAVGLASSAQDVVLFDTDLQFGDVADALRLAPTVNFSDAVNAGLADLTVLKLALTPHPTGVYALCASDLPADADDITGEHVARAISLLREEFPYVVVDTDAGIGERTLAAIEMATDLVFLCATDVPSVRSLRKEIEALDTIGLTHQRRHFVLNRSDAKVGLSAADIQDTISHRIDVFVPSSRLVPMSMNQGIPLLETGVASPAAEALHKLVVRLAPDVLPAPSASRRVTNRRRKEA